MSRIILTLFFGLVGFFVGYMIFGTFLGEQIPLDKIFFNNTNDAVYNVISQIIIKPIKEKILISSAIGAIIGLFISFIPISEKSKIKDKINSEKF